jgi:hypothetical protein
MGSLSSPVSDKHLNALGRVTAYFSQLEDELCRLAWSLLGAEPAVGQIVTAELSFKGLLNLIGCLGQHRFADQPLMTQLEDALKRAVQVEEERNVLIHSAWFAGETNDQVHRIKITAKRKSGRRVQIEQVQPQDIEEVAQRIAETTFVVSQVNLKYP